MLAVFWSAVLSPAPATGAQRPAGSQRVNQAFLKHLDTLGPRHALAAAAVRRGWARTYRDRPAQAFVPDALAVLYPDFGALLAAFDDGRAADVLRLAEPLRRQADPYVRANASYLYIRALVDLGLLAEARQLAEQEAGPAGRIASHSPFGAQLLLLRAYCQARDLDPQAAADTLRALQTRFPDAPEPVRFNARQLLLEIQRRQSGTLDEVAELMDYSAGRLHAADPGPHLRQRQRRIVALLEELIRRAARQERAGAAGQGRGALPEGAPRRPARSSRAPAGPGAVGALHGAPAANPGEMWGRLPPAERERILQSLGQRFPSRYRQLVEQYYRSLAERKE